VRAVAVFDRKLALSVQAVFGTVDDVGAARATVLGE